MYTFSVVTGLRHDRVGVGPSAGLHVRHELRVRDVTDVEHSDTANSLLADRIGHAAKAAVRPAVGRL